MFLVTLAVVGALACDGNNDGRVTVDELVTGVAAALATDPCGDCALCPEMCAEFPSAVINGRRIACEASFCDGIDQTACVRFLIATQPLQCAKVPTP